MEAVMLTVFAVLTASVLSCPLDTRVIEDDPGCDVCQCCRFANEDYNVYCQSRGLTSVPLIPADTTYLDLRQNPILHLHKYSFPRLPRLTSLLLGNDTREPFALLTADSDIFRNLPALKNLTLSVNLDNVTAFLSSAKNLKNLVLMCVNQTTEENYKILFSGLKLDVLEVHSCSFDVVEDTFTNHANSTVPKKLLMYISNKHPARIIMPNTKVSLWYNSTDSSLFLEELDTALLTNNCIGPTTSSCQIRDPSGRLINLHFFNMNVDVLSYSGQGSLWPLSGTTLLSCSFRVQDIDTNLEEIFVTDLLSQDPGIPVHKVASKLSLSTENFPRYSLLGNTNMRSICLVSKELSLQGYLLGEITRFDFDLTSFTCSDCLLFCSNCFIFSESLRKLNITDTRSRVLIDLGATLKANTDLEELVLNTNRLTVDMRSIPPHPNLVHLELSASTYLTNIYAPSNFSALMNLERFIVKNIHHVEQLDADLFSIAGLEKLTYMDFSDWSVNIVGRFDDLFSGLSSLRELRMSNNGFWKTIDRLEELLRPVARQLEILDLSDNRMSILPDSLLQEMYHLRRLNLSGNYLTTLDSGVFQNSKHLSLISLHDNRLETVDVWYFYRMEYLRVVDFSGNRFPCTCANRGLQAWIKNGRETNRLLLDYNGLCADTDTRARTKFMNYTLAWIECDSHALYVSVAAPSAFVTVIIAALITVFYYRYDIQFWWIVKRRYRINRRHRIDPEKKFHAFLSYASSEQELATDIFFELENGRDIKFRIAYNHREFLAGYTIADNIIRCIDLSEKVLFLISREFIRRDWCEFEMNFAQMRCFDEHRNVIILIFVEKLKTSELPKRLRILCRHVNYLQYPDHADRRAVQNFWHRLRLSLAQDSLLDQGEPDDDSEDDARLGEDDAFTTANEHTSLIRGVV